jgi:hypothetical protein
MKAMEKELEYSTSAAEEADTKTKQLEDQLRECNNKVHGETCM